ACVLEEEVVQGQRLRLALLVAQPAELALHEHQRRPRMVGHAKRLEQALVEKHATQVRGTAADLPMDAVSALELHRPRTELIEWTWTHQTHQVAAVQMGGDRRFP